MITDKVKELIKQDIEKAWNELNKIQIKINSWEESESIIKKEKLKELRTEFRKTEKEINKMYKKIS